MDTIRENKMGTMPITKLLFTMSGPAILSMLFNALYNIIDSMFVAQIGQKALAAVSIAFPIQMLIVAVAVGTAVGLNSLISRRLGARRYEDANRAATTGLFLGIINWIPFLIFGLFFAKMFMGLFSDDTYIINEGSKYLSIVTGMSLFVMVEINIEKISQSTGNMIFPMISLMVGALFNIILDPILIFGLFGMPELGVSGAAIATVIAQFLGTIVGFLLLTKKVKAIKIQPNRNVLNWVTVREIYAVGLPAIIMQAVFSVMLLGINSILATFSVAAVAVMGVYGKLQSFAFMPCFGINQGALPVMGFNYGAENKKRLMDTFKTAIIMALTIMVICTAIFQLIPEKLLYLFNAESEMLSIGIRALKIISIGFIPAAIGIIAAGLFQATGHGIISMWGSLIRQLVAVLPLAYLFGKIGGVYMVWFAFPIAEIIGMTYNIVMIIVFYKKRLKHLGEEQKNDNYN
ncbi:MAG: MATE family efflux transporter [Anaerovoracaceae bacterium]